MHFRGNLQVDPDRGVAYFFDDTGGTILRIEGLPTPVPDPIAQQMIDIRLLPATSNNTEQDDADSKGEGTIRARHVLTWEEVRKRNREFFDKKKS